MPKRKNALPHGSPSQPALSFDEEYQRYFGEDQVDEGNVKPSPPAPRSTKRSSDAKIRGHRGGRRKTTGAAKSDPRSSQSPTYSPESHTGTTTTMENTGGLANVGPVDEERLGGLVAEIHESRLGCLRVGKALIEFGRTAGQRLLQVRELIGEKGFDAWVSGQLGISTCETQALILFAQEPAVASADVSPATAVAPTLVWELVSLLRDHLRR